MRRLSILALGLGTLSACGSELDLAGDVAGTYIGEIAGDVTAVDYTTP